MTRLKEWREARHLTQEELAQRTGLRQSYISNLEKDRVKYPILPVGLRLAVALNIHPQDLISLEPHLTSQEHTDVATDRTGEAVKSKNTIADVDPGD